MRWGWHISLPSIANSRNSVQSSLSKLEMKDLRSDYAWEVDDAYETVWRRGKPSWLQARETGRGKGSFSSSFLVFLFCFFSLYLFFLSLMLSLKPYGLTYTNATPTTLAQTHKLTKAPFFFSNTAIVTTFSFG